MSNTGLVAQALKEHVEESVESRRDLAKSVEEHGREQTRLAERIATIARAMESHERDADERHRSSKSALDSHAADDRQAMAETRDGLASLARDVTVIRSRLSWASGALWAVAAVITVIGVGVLTVGKFAAERWVREISDKAIEAAMMQQKWSKP